MVLEMSTQRITFGDFKRSGGPEAVGICAADSPGIARQLNQAQRRLIQAGGDEGWFGTWAKMVFNVSKDDPYLTTPRTVARISNLDVCNVPVRIQNEFFEFLEFGAGLQRPPPDCATNRCTCNLQMYDRGTVPLFRDLTPGYKLRFYIMNAADTGKRMFIAGARDVNGTDIYTMDNGVTVNGIFVTFDNLFPFVESPIALNEIGGLQKDETVGQVKIYQVNPVTDEQTLLSTMDPSEKNAYYRRYFIQGLPQRCCECDQPQTTVQLTAMAKLEFIPVKADTDYLIISNEDALKAECQAIRYEEMDSPASAQMAQVRHRAAIRFLNNELVHYTGKSRPAIGFHPFGYETLARVGTGMI
jgi:hypothetical protein